MLEVCVVFKHNLRWVLLTLLLFRFFVLLSGERCGSQKLHSTRLNLIAACTRRYLSINLHHFCALDDHGGILRLILGCGFLLEFYYVGPDFVPNRAYFRSNFIECLLRLI